MKKTNINFRTDRPTAHRRLRRHRNVAAAPFPAHATATCRRDSLRPQYHRVGSKPTSCSRMPGMRLHAFVHLRRHGGRQSGSLSQCHRSRAFRGRCFRHRRSQSSFANTARLIGESCRALGFNTDFAPVVDLAFEASRNVMSSRAVSADPKEATVYAREFLAGLRSAGVLGAIKHFPGLGEANLDTHHELPSVEKPWKKLWGEDIAPYRALRRESPLVLVGHAAIPR